MKRQLLTVLFLVTLAQLTGCSRSDDAPPPIDPDALPFRYLRAKSVPMRCYYADLLRDGTSACIQLGRDPKLNSSYFIVHAADGSNIDQINFFNTESVIPWFPYDFNHDGDLDLFVVASRGDSLFAVIIDALHANHSTPLLTLPLYQPPPRRDRPASDVTARLWGVVERERGKAPLLIATTTAGFSGGPRQVMAFDLSSGKLAWSSRLASPVASLVFTLPVVDSFPSIFFGTNAPDNGVSSEEFDDSHSYLVALSGQGTMLWSRRMGEKFSSTLVALSDLDGDGRKEVISFSLPGTMTTDKAYVSASHARTGTEIARKEFPEPMANYSVFGTLNANSRFQHYAFCSKEGNVMLLDHDFSLLAQRNIGARVADISLCDLRADKEPEVSVTLEAGGIEFMESDLEPIAYIPPSEIPEGFAAVAVPLGPARQPLLALMGETGTIVGSLETNPGRFARWSVMLGKFLALFAALTLVGYVAFRSIVYSEVYRALGREDRSFGLMLLTPHGRVVQVNHGFKHLLRIDYGIRRWRPWHVVFHDGLIAPLTTFLKAALPLNRDVEERVDLSLGGATVNLVVRIFPITIGPVRVGTLVVLGNLTKSLQSDRLVNWALVAQNLAHEMKTPLSTIRFTLERIRQSQRNPPARQPAGMDPYLESVEEEVRRLDQYVRGFMKLANLNPPHRQLSDLNGVLDACLDAYGERMPRSVHLVREYGQDLPGVEIDVNLFTTAVTNLVDNALAAMKGEGRLRISTYLAQILTEEWVCCSVADSGCGIGEADIPKVFEPYFTTNSSGTGLGLVITKKIVEDHGGTITFHTRLGLGTEFTIRLPGGAGMGGARHG